MNKKKIEKSFDQGAKNYHWAACVQKEVADNLIHLTPDHAQQRILEIGCGTGFLTSMLQQKYPNARITAIDISSKMIEHCRQKFDNIEFIKTDAEQFQTDEKYDLIISNMTVQWFDDPNITLQRYQTYLSTKGKIIFSTIGEKNFYEWRNVLTMLSLPSGLLEIKKYNHIEKEEEIKTIYHDPMDFIRSLKRMGASHSQEKPLSPLQIKRACHALQKEYNGSMTWHILYGVINAV